MVIRVARGATREEAQGVVQEMEPCLKPHDGRLMLQRIASSLARRGINQ